MMRTLGLAVCIILAQTHSVKADATVYRKTPLYSGEVEVGQIAPSSGGEAVASYILINNTKNSLNLVPGISLQSTLRGGEPQTDGNNTNVGYTLRRYAENAKAIAGISGGYIDDASVPTPLGLVKVNSRTISKAHKSWLLNGALCENKGKIEIIKWKEKADSTFPNCIQAGPVLVYDGQNTLDDVGSGLGQRKLLESMSRHSVVCIQDNRAVAFIMAESARLTSLVDILTDKEIIRCKAAIRLTSGPFGAIFYFNKQDNSYVYIGPTDRLLPNAILAQRK